MGIVYKARQKSLDRIVALKLLLADPFRDPRIVERFKVEARAAAALTHPNIVVIYQLGHCHAGHYYVMEYIEGQSLERLLSKGPVPVPWAVQMLMYVADAVHAAHTKGIIHRDLKPSNILLERDRGPVVLDFGIAKVVGLPSPLTDHGAIVGTPAFMAPEQTQQTEYPVGPRTDVYSLGALLYTALTRRPPFEGNSGLDVLLKVASNEMPPRPRKLRKDIPIELENLCMKCLSKKPQDRFPSALALSKALRNVRSALKIALANETVKEPDSAEPAGAARPTEPAPAPALPRVTVRSLATRRKIRLTRPMNLIGRSSACDIILRFADVSKRHCLIRITGDRVTVEDLKSINGIKVNGAAVQRCELKDGDRLDVAGHEFEIRCKPAAPA